MSAVQPDKIDITPSLHDGSTLEAEVPPLPAKLRRKIDIRVVTSLAFLYFFAFLDRINLGNAMIFGLREDLKLKGVEENLLVFIFFIPYVLFEAPCNLLMKRLRPSITLSACCLGFGIITLCQAFTTNFAGLMVCRVVLGAFEAGILPGIWYLLATWYRREESGKRFAAIYVGIGLSGAFGGLFAGAIGKMKGVRGLSGWKWIFILEGILTIIAAFISYFAVPDFPEDVNWLTEEEKTVVINRLKSDIGESGRHDPVTLKSILGQFKDYKFVCGGIMYFGIMLQGHAFSFFGPTIIRAQGYTADETQYRTVPLWIVGCVLTLALSYLSDKYKHRYAFAVFSYAIFVVSALMLRFVRGNQDALYAAMFLLFMGSMTAAPLVVGWWSTNLVGHKEKVIGTAYILMMGNVAGVPASFMFQKEDAPHYEKGFTIGLVMSLVAFLATTVYFVGCLRENKRAMRVYECHQGEGGRSSNEKPFQYQL
ncbi:MFS general substrate transporter [Ascobolus immersus RN42]|uniref:MFS general substrate transporter n=1 Tax=Ascobolus immersus RN42 TaxID=1160509 RepID=A0A3N4J302_ASCIM|nr:MFS general substrate transporter [Ascobolus immersus RN42]